jgi:hypothetical protein
VLQNGQVDVFEPQAAVATRASNSRHTQNDTVDRSRPNRILMAGTDHVHYYQHHYYSW